MAEARILFIVCNDTFFLVYHVQLCGALQASLERIFCLTLGGFFSFDLGRKFICFFFSDTYCCKLVCAADL